LDSISESLIGLHLAGGVQLSLFIYVLIYLSSIVLANFMALWFGPKAIIINAFLLIGLDLSLQDKLHDRWRHNRLWLKMFLLIFSSSMIT